MKRVILIYGLIAGAIEVSLLFTVMAMANQIKNFDKGEVLGYTSMLISLSLIFFGIKSFRDNDGKGTITFGKGFKVGILIAVIASSMYVIGWMTYVSMAEPDFGDKYYAHYIEKVKSSGKPQVEIDQQVKELENMKVLYQNKLVQIGATFLEIFPVGLLITVVSALVLKRKGILPA